MTKILNYIWRGWMIILGAVLTIVMGIPVLLLSIRKEHYKYAYQFIRFWCIGMFYGMGFRYELKKLTDKKIDKNTQYVIIANHTSIMDVMLPCILLPHHPLCYVGKKELVKIPIFGTIYKRICVMVDRSSAKSRADVYRRCAERMEEGQSIVIFPEGGVPDDTSVILDDFKARKMAQHLGLTYTGTIGVIIKAKPNGIIPSIKPYLEKIKATNFRISPEIELLAYKESKEL